MENQNKGMDKEEENKELTEGRNKEGDNGRLELSKE